MALIQSIGSRSHGTKGGYGADPHGDGVAEESRQMWSHRAKVCGRPNLGLLAETGRL